MFPYWTFIKYGIPLLIGMIIAGVGVGKVQQMRIDRVKAESTAARSVYEANIQTITGLKSELEKAQRSCDARITGRDQTIKRLKDIDSLRGRDEKADPDNSGDSIAIELNRMWQAASAN